MLVASAPRGGDDSRPRPKRPDVLITTAATGEGVPELLAALDKHRASGRVGESSGARLARAEAQVWAIVAERLRERLHDATHTAATEALLADVAEHRLDPYAAADRLLDEINRG
jgi:LAO/AO transport system kinase